MLDEQIEYGMVFVLLAVYESGVLYQQVYGMSLASMLSPLAAATVLAFQRVSMFEKAYLSFILLCIGNLQMWHRYRGMSAEQSAMLLSAAPGMFVKTAAINAFFAPIEWCLGISPTVLLRTGLVFPPFSGDYWEGRRVILHGSWFAIRYYYKITRQFKRTSVAFDRALLANGPLSNQTHGYYYSRLSEKDINDAEGIHPLTNVRAMAIRGLVSTEQGMGVDILPQGMRAGLDAAHLESTGRFTKKEFSKLSMFSQQLYRQYVLEGTVDMQDILSLGVWSDNFFCVEAPENITPAQSIRHEECQQQILDSVDNPVALSKENRDIVAQRVNYFLFQSPSKMKEVIMQLLLAMRKLSLPTADPVINCIIKWCYLLSIETVGFKDQSYLVVASQHRDTPGESSSIIMGYGVFSREARRYLESKKDIEFSNHLRQQPRDSTPPAGRWKKARTQAVEWLIST